MKNRTKSGCEYSINSDVSTWRMDKVGFFKIEESSDLKSPQNRRVLKFEDKGSSKLKIGVLKFEDMGSSDLKISDPAIHCESNDSSDAKESIKESIKEKEKERERCSQPLAEKTVLEKTPQISLTPLHHQEEKDRGCSAIAEQGENVGEHPREKALLPAAEETVIGRTPKDSLTLPSLLLWFKENTAFKNFNAGALKPLREKFTQKQLCEEALKASSKFRSKDKKPQDPAEWFINRWMDKVEPIPDYTKLYPKAKLPPRKEEGKTAASL
jgi:hypothetical protein